ncbi:MAG: methyltransferase [Rhizobiales bacterium]|nr:methyltransferase [Hyphomicrobiales bacterium]
MARRERQERRRTSPEQPFRPMRRAYAPIEVLSGEDEERVHRLSLRLLGETGLKFLSPDTWPVLARSGCLVDRETGMVRMPSEVVEHFLALAPSSFTLHARNPANDLAFGGDLIHYGSASSAPNVIDLDRGRRPGTRRDFEDLVRLNHMLGTCAFHSGHPVEPIDTPVNTRHLTSALAWHTLSDKVTRVYAIGRTRVHDSIAMAAIAYGLGRDEFERAPRLHGGINVNSPLVVDAPLSEAAMELALAGQVNVVSPVAFAGAMSPITLSGSIIQCNAEAIGLIAFLQMVQAGAPCFYGVLTTPVDMKSGAPAMGVPETVTGTLANGQMARRYRIPQRVMLGSTSVSPDAQSACETMFSLWAAQLGGAHMVYHAHGWMEGGLTTGFEKTVLDSEMIAMMGALAGSIDFSDAEEAMEAIRQVGPGGHFLGTDHTLKRYENAFHKPILSDWRAYEFWQRDGAKDAAMRANAKWKEMLEAYRAPALEDGIHDALEEYVTRRSRELGDAEI